MHCSTGFGPNCKVLPCKTGLQQACVTAAAPMEICCSYRCAVMQHQGSAALFRARYEEKLQEKGAQHKALEEALKDYGYNVTTLPIII